MYKFIMEPDLKTSHHYSNKLTMEISRGSALPEMLEAFEDFLKGCGYSFSGHVDIVEEEEERDSSLSEDGSLRFSWTQDDHGYEESVEGTPRPSSCYGQGGAERGYDNTPIQDFLKEAAELRGPTSKLTAPEAELIKAVARGVEPKTKPRGARAKAVTKKAKK